MSLNPQDIVVGAIDVGAPKNIGWAIVSGGDVEHGGDLDEFIAKFAKASAGKVSALGFEAPMFIPHGRPLQKLTSQRNGDNGKPWSAGAGATVTTIGLAIVSHALAGLREYWNDALNAAQGFVAALSNLDAANAVSETNVLSLIGACMMRTGWAETDSKLLSQPCLVIRP